MRNKIMKTDAHIWRVCKMLTGYSSLKHQKSYSNLLRFYFILGFITRKNSFNDGATPSSPYGSTDLWGVQTRGNTAFLYSDFWRRFSSRILSHLSLESQHHCRQSNQHCQVSLSVCPLPHHRSPVFIPHTLRFFRISGGESLLSLLFQPFGHF